MKNNHAPCSPLGAVPSATLVKKFWGGAWQNILTEEKSSLIYVCTRMYIYRALPSTPTITQGGEGTVICLCSAAPWSSSAPISSVTFCLYFRLDCHLISLPFARVGFVSVKGMAGGVGLGLYIGRISFGNSAWYNLMCGVIEMASAFKFLTART